MSLLRTFAEIAARGRVFRRSIQVAGRQVELYVSPDAQLKYAKLGKNAFDADLIHIAECFITESDCIWDVGANVGVFSFAAASLASKGTVVAIEADIWLAGLLRQTCALPQHLDQDIRVIPMAIASEDGVLKFRIAQRGRASNSIAVVEGSSQMGGIREEQYVPSLRLDTLLKSAPGPDFIKIDVEGAEGLALAGAEEIINNVRPMFYIEISAQNFLNIKSKFDASDYTAFDEMGSVVQQYVGGNYFFVPNEKPEKKDAMEAFRKQIA